MSVCVQINHQEKCIKDPRLALDGSCFLQSRCKARWVFFLKSFWARVQLNRKIKTFLFYSHLQRELQWNKLDGRFSAWHSEWKVLKIISSWWLNKRLLEHTHKFFIWASINLWEQQLQFIISATKENFRVNGNRFRSGILLTTLRMSTLTARTLIVS